MQSPICVFQEISEIQHYTPYLFTGYNQLYEASIVYTEHTIRIELLSDKDLPTICGGGLFKEYVLNAFEFHWESEHAINDKRYPLEVQLIHYAKCYGDFSNALNYKDGIAILSTFYIISEYTNEAIENLIESIPNLEMKLNQSVQIEGGVIPRQFLTPRVEKFYRYNGSLTRPCFDETVIWTLFTKPLQITETQFARLIGNWKYLNKSLTENNRPLQEINDRNIYLSAI